MTETPSCSPRCGRWLVAPVVIASILAIVTAVGQTRLEWFREHDTEGFWHVRVWDFSATLVPVSVLLFALGVQWVIGRRPVLAVAALLPLPVWAVCLLLVDSLLANDVWVALLLAPLSGVQPFGVR